MSIKNNPSIPAFKKDIEENKGYLYSTGSQLSSQIANRRLSDVSMQMISYEGKKVIDIGCGDGVYTMELYDRCNPQKIVGIDPVVESFNISKKIIGDRNIEFLAYPAEKTPFDDNSFDIAYIRGLLHHMDEPQKAIKEALRVANEVIVIEPNGYNLGLKVIEKLSSYHRTHGEKSFSPRLLNNWVMQYGGQVENYKYAGFVPMFCTDWIARTLKFIEPIIETLPIIKQLGSAVYIFHITKNN